MRFCEAMRGRPLIFNLGHGILPETPIAHVEQLLRGYAGSRHEARCRPVQSGRTGFSPEAVEPFLRNLFSDPAIIALPGIFALAAGAADRPAARADRARDLRPYRRPLADRGGDPASRPRAGSGAVSRDGVEAKAFVAMRCWHPFSDDAARAVKAFAARQDRAAAALSAIFHHHDRLVAQGLGRGPRRQAGLTTPTTRGLLLSRGARALSPRRPRISAQHWPKIASRACPIACCCRRMACPSASSRRGDPYQWQVEQIGRRDCGGAGDAGSGTGGLLPEPGRAAGMDRARDRCGNPRAPAATARASSSRRSPLSANIPKRWSSWISNMPSWRAKPACRIIAAPPRWARIRDFIAGLAGLVRRALDGKTVDLRRRAHLSRAIRDAAATIGRMLMDALRNELSNYIPWIKAFHVIAVIAWMSGHALSAAAVRLSHRDRAGLANPANASR